jgi:Poly A polymerase head domain
VWYRLGVNELAQCALAPERKDLQGQEKSGMGVIAANPDQSKHLETATLKLHGLSIDMVHLRNEKYTEESRIPMIEVGTPAEDAERRDFTINSLFYNVNSQKVEDFTGKGLEDLKNGIIRTPLDPRITFLDGELQILHQHRPVDNSAAMLLRSAVRGRTFLSCIRRASVQIHCECCEVCALLQDTPSH